MTYTIKTPSTNEPLFDMLKRMSRINREEKMQKLMRLCVVYVGTIESEGDM